MAALTNGNEGGTNIDVPGEGEKSKFTLGQRVKDETGCRATVRYIGPVCTAKKADSVWIGVEFDDPERGKHDGAVVNAAGEVVRYFTCEHSGSGSFLRPEKVDIGVDLALALEQNYVAIDAPLLAPENVLTGQFAQTCKGGKKPIEFFGEEKIRVRQQVAEIDTCTLREAGISRCGSTSALTQLAGHVISLDLKANLLSEWTEIACISKALPKLQTLAIAQNRLIPMSIPAQMSIQGAFPVLRCLVINSCGLQSWQQIQILEAHMPMLEELYAADNNFSDLCEIAGEKVRGFSGLKVLDLSECRLSTSQQVHALSALPKLESLSLNHNPLTSASAPFPCVTLLQIHGTSLANWSDIDALSSIPHLSSLRIGGCPVTAGLSAWEARAAIVARLPNITKVNGSPVSARERAEAEKTYLRTIAREAMLALKAGVSNEEWERTVQKIHPQYKRLTELWGTAGARSTDNTNGVSSSLSNDMVMVTLRSAASDSCTKDPVSKKLPSGLSVGKLKQLLKRLFGLDMDLQVLYMSTEESKKEGAPPVCLEDEGQPLSFYGVCDMCQITMDEVGKDKTSATEKQAKIDAEARLQSQMSHMEAMDKAKKMQVEAESKAARSAASK